MKHSFACMFSTKTENHMLIRIASKKEIIMNNYNFFINFGGGERKNLTGLAIPDIK